MFLGLYHVALSQFWLWITKRRVMADRKGHCHRRGHSQELEQQVSPFATEPELLCALRCNAQYFRNISGVSVWSLFQTTAAIPSTSKTSTRAELSKTSLSKNKTESAVFEHSAARSRQLFERRNRWKNALTSRRLCARFAMSRSSNTERTGNGAVGCPR